ncbi:ly-6/neurotoxin-like protein 1 [Sarcophilus harrisii]|uniref:Ly-6/neurotoxin-like protein 1 n=1 Tax=Sarcophilus harrisii TaxID=9305 RepID=A0A7N4PH60_SARHA|nr:ly-6/neurotoxin-like protein 1 [Sarcophilus harrisii]
MKFFPVLLLMTIMAQPLTHALECYVCEHKGYNCFKTMRCPDYVNYCMTTRTYITPTRVTVSKSCVPTCFETLYDGYTKNAATTSCCQYDYCNGASLGAQASSALALTTILSTLWGLLPPSL